MSDLHLEFRKYDLDFLNRKDLRAEADLLVLAGDILPWTNPYDIWRAMEAFMRRWSRIFYVPGNHEYYGTSPDNAHVMLREAQLPSNVTVATTPGVYYCGNQRLLLGTGWYNQKSVECIPANPRTGTYRSEGLQLQFSDYRWIDKLAPWVYRQADDAKFLLSEHLRADDIVITHHLPHAKSVPPYFAGHPDGPFFLNDDLQHLLLAREPKLWIHGHTHTACDYTVGGTRVVCNPRGYPGEGGVGKVERPYPAVVVEA